MSVMLGACVSRARLQATDGAPMPTKHTSSFFNTRAAATAIISAVEYFMDLPQTTSQVDWRPWYQDKGLVLASSRETSRDPVRWRPRPYRRRYRAGNSHGHRMGAHRLGPRR